jgi:hypothetical protein
MNILAAVAADLLKAMLPELLSFIWEKTHEPVTVEEARTNDDRRSRLLAAIRLRRSAGDNHPQHPTAPTG